MTRGAPPLAAAAVLCLLQSAGADTQVEHGRYLATVAACVGCHTARTPGAAPLSGGARFGAGAKAVVSPNITPDGDTGIGTWSEADIVAALHEGRRPDGSRIGPPMPQHAFARLSDCDAAAIAAYLKSVPPIHNALDHGPRPETSATSTAARPAAAPRDDPRGRYLFEAVVHCGECHATGAGEVARRFAGSRGPIAAPPLTPVTLGGMSDADLGHLIVTGRRPDGSVLDGPMPVAAYASLTPQDLDALVAFLKTGVP